MSLSYTYQPQPPSHPKTAGGKRGPSAPISIVSSSNEDEDSDTSITDFSPPVPSRLIPLDNASFTANNNNNSKPSVLSITSISSPRSHIGNKKISYSPRTLITNVNTGLSSSNNTTSYQLKTTNSNYPSNNCLNINNNNTNNSHTSSDFTCPSILNSGVHNLSSSSTTSNTNNTNTNTFNLNSSFSLSNSNPLSKAHSSSLSISLNTNNCSSSNNSSSIPAITNSALSPTLPTSNCSPTTTSSTGQTNKNSSSHDSSKENNSPSSSPHNRASSPSSTFAYEHDHDYENVASPCSSTASGPIYVRQPGFQHHAHQVVLTSTNKVKKKKSIDLHEGLRKREPTPPKLKPKRGTIPMKLRALPQSFWQQPNVTQQVSPASMFPILPPLCNKDSEEEMEERPVTPPVDEREPNKRVSERKVTVANTDLLFKLFEGIGEEKKTSQSKSRQINKLKKAVPKSTTKGLFMGKDPFLMEDVTQKIFPQLTLEGSKHSGVGTTTLQVVTLREGDKTVTFPSLSTNEQNCNQMLSEVVINL